MDTITVGIDGMTCGGCVASVESALGRVPGVKKVRARLETKDAVVEGEHVDVAKVRAAVEGAGFEVRG